MKMLIRSLFVREKIFLLDTVLLALLLVLALTALDVHAESNEPYILVSTDVQRDVGVFLVSGKFLIFKVGEEIHSEIKLKRAYVDSVDVEFYEKAVKKTVSATVRQGQSISLSLAKLKQEASKEPLVSNNVLRVGNNEDFID